MKYIFRAFSRIISFLYITTTRFECTYVHSLVMHCFTKYYSRQNIVVLWLAFRFNSFIICYFVFLFWIMITKRNVCQHIYNYSTSIDVITLIESITVNRLIKRNWKLLNVVRKAFMTIVLYKFCTQVWCSSFIVTMCMYLNLLILLYVDSYYIHYEKCVSILRILFIVVK